MNPTPKPCMSRQMEAGTEVEAAGATGAAGAAAEATAVKTSKQCNESSMPDDKHMIWAGRASIVILAIAVGAMVAARKADATKGKADNHQANGQTDGRADE